jgi:hypothetical protein
MGSPAYSSLSRNGLYSGTSVTFMGDEHVSATGDPETDLMACQMWVVDRRRAEAALSGINKLCADRRNEQAAQHEAERLAVTRVWWD